MILCSYTVIYMSTAGYIKVPLALKSRKVVLKTQQVELFKTLMAKMHCFFNHTLSVLG